MQKMQKCKKLKSTQKCKLKNKIGHQLLVQKSELGRGFRDFRPCIFSLPPYPQINALCYINSQCIVISQEGT